MSFSNGEQHVNRDSLGPHEGKERLVTLCSALADCGVKGYSIFYSGCYESGEASDASHEPEEAIVSDELHGLVQDWVLTILPDGWDQDEGSRGWVTIDVASSTACVEHEWYVLHTKEESFDI